MDAEHDESVHFPRKFKKIAEKLNYIKLLTWSQYLKILVAVSCKFNFLSFSITYDQDLIAVQDRKGSQFRKNFACPD